MSGLLFDICGLISNWNLNCVNFFCALQYTEVSIAVPLSDLEDPQASS